MFTYGNTIDEKDWIKWVFNRQDELALQSAVFAKILNEEIRGIEDDPKARLEATEWNLKSRARNAMRIRNAYYNGDTKTIDQEAWEKDLLTDSFYGLV